MNEQIRQRQLEKERKKALGDVLVAECRSDAHSLANVAALIAGGADISYKNSRPLYFATKLHKFDLVKYLIDNGALEPEIAAVYISTMCDFKGFDDGMEPAFFEILDAAHEKTGDRMTLFTPYINGMAVAGRLDKLRALMKRYYLTEREVVSVIYLRIIFEIVIAGYDEILKFIERHKKWIDQASFDLSVSTNEWIVLEHIVENSDLRVPSDAAVAEAVYQGSFETLTILEKTGYDFSGKPLFLEKACRAAYSNGTQSFEFLLRHGYSARDIYNGKSVREHAVEDNNTPLLGWLDANGIKAF
jgi:hypothetical protein